MRETKVDRLIIDDLNEMAEKHICTWHKNNGNIYQTSGRADFTACVKGRYVDIEAKAGNGYPIKLNQLFEGYKTCLAGGYFIVAFPDYTHLLDLPVEYLDWNFKAEKANELRDQELQQAIDLRSRINREKRSILFKTK